MELNKIYNENCLDTMQRMPDNFIDLTVTSPPYDNLRTYKGFVFPFEKIAKELFRVTKAGGCVVWVVGDATINGSETGTSFKQALFFMDCGFRLHDTMIYYKTHSTPLTHNRYEQYFEYMFVFSKGKPKAFNPILENTVRAGDKHIRTKSNKENGSAMRSRQEYSVCKETKIIRNVWHIAPNNTRHEHPAMFPEQLAHNHIISWSNENDLVYDPFMGSGTTAKMAILNNRNYIGSEISSEYCEIIEKRLQLTNPLFAV
jgi:site-specific DNA-methyltransferase (adenine-specific)